MTDAAGAKALKQRIEQGKQWVPPPPSRLAEELRSAAAAAHRERRRSPAPPPPEPRTEVRKSSFVDDPMAELWREAGDRETGAAAVEAVRARHHDA